MKEKLTLQQWISAVSEFDTIRSTGTVTDVVGLLIRSRGPLAAMGDLVEIEVTSQERVLAQVIGFRDDEVLSMALENVAGLRPGCKVIARRAASLLPVGPGLLGRVIDGLGRPIDGGPPIQPAAYYPLHASPPNPLTRRHISDLLVTGIRAIDGLLTLGKGQRMGIFGGSGVGKSTLLGAIARHTLAEVNVVTLVGERNREVREFIDHDLGPEGLKKSIVVVATSDRPAPLRVHSCFVSLAIAEYFRDQGADALLIMDSITRLAMAQREIGLASGEPPSQKGYTPSVFQLLPRIFERAGCFDRGSITGLFTVLVEGDDFNEPICDTARSILDGHIVLSRRLADSGHYPAIDVLASVSRLAAKVATPEIRSIAQCIREALSAYQRAEDLIHLGAYAKGSNPLLDCVIANLPKLTSFLRQGVGEVSGMDETANRMRGVAQTLGAACQPEAEHAIEKGLPIRQQA